MDNETFESLLWEQINKAHNNMPKTQIIDAIENVVKAELEIDLKTYLCDPLMRARLEIEETKGSSSL